MIPNERPTPLTDAMLEANGLRCKCADKPIELCIELEQRLAERTKERDEARAICAHSEGMAVHAITCIHHTDAERAALSAHGNCPVCAKRLLDTALAKLAKCREALEKCANVMHYHADKCDSDTEDVETYALARQTLEETK